MMKKIAVAVLLAAMFSSAFSMGQTETKSNSREAKWAKDNGLDKDESVDELYQKAKAEGALVIYTISSRTQKVANAFKEAYPGINVEVYDISSGTLKEKFATEYKSGIRTVDILHSKEQVGEYTYEMFSEGMLHNYQPASIFKNVPASYMTLTPLMLELKVLADVGLLGMPNAGKSTLITAVSAARPKIADYPFTTLHPNLGVVRLDENHSFVMADIPGLIEGAAEGAGLGHRFLKHLSRTGLLLHVVDLAPFDEETEPAAEALAIINELRKYDEELFDKPRWLVLNKLDMLSEEEAEERAAAFLEAVGWDYPAPDDRFEFDMHTPRLFKISALTYQGTQDLVHQIGRYLTEKKRLAAEAEAAGKAAADITAAQPKTDTSVLKAE